MSCGIAAKVGVKQQSNIKSNKKLYVVAIVVNEGHEHTWYVDFDVFHHMSHDIQSFMTYTNTDHGQAVFLVDNTTHRIHGQGEVSLRLANGQIREIPNVLYVLRPKKNFFFCKVAWPSSGKNLN